ncbi:MAG: hypothetical protein GY820_07960 [Gammaproteobacteria bacterium]|nr:hypothetical protein [Gammaproteobacteria bacterium]
MPAQYSHRQFFRRVPNHQLEKYFKSKKADLGIDFSKLNDKEVDSIFNAFANLPTEQQAGYEAEFQDINAMACEAGIAALIDEAGYHQDDEAFAASIASIEGFHGKSIWAFLNKPEYWRGANMFLHADNVSASYWKKRNDLPSVPPNVDDDDIARLEEGISKFFHSTEGRGKNCKVEPYRRNEKEYFFAYPEDYSQSGVEWVSDSLKTLAHHPAFEIIFVYSENEGSLDIYAPKNTKAVPELQKIFAQSIMGLNTLSDGVIDKRVYVLAPVDDVDFEFKIEPEMGIASAVVTRLRLTLKHGDKRRIVLEADTRNNENAVFDLLGELKPPAYHITQIDVVLLIYAC